MEDELVTIETAHELKRKGFDEYCEWGWHSAPCIIDLEVENVTTNSLLVGKYKEYACAPTQSLAQKWLREKHNLHIEICSTIVGWKWLLDKADSGTAITDSNDAGPNSSGMWDSYEQALENGLQTTLHLVYCG